jgi:hypothetical protein
MDRDFVNLIERAARGVVGVAANQEKNNLLSLFSSSLFLFPQEVQRHGIFWGIFEIVGYFK